jgi:hypothetical protein
LLLINTSSLFKRFDDIPHAQNQLALPEVLLFFRHFFNQILLKATLHLTFDMIIFSLMVIPWGASENISYGCYLLSMIFNLDH